MRPRPNLPRSSSRSASGSDMAVPRSIGLSGVAARSGSALHSRQSVVNNSRNGTLMPPITPCGVAYSSKKGASPRGEAPWLFALCASARDDQTLAGDDHPSAVLLADGIDAADAGNGIAGI